ncbi:HlyD family type I secretion periplasmic adaptor subunit [Ideonella livida]|uniref:Membrane fusion protein (MFP) family protein n=1 Tax=Ideonella livida TaxID=2707176 RepID=A0A7C9TIS0_9BURK|nr:HlyD family type I secretion periplasmic adaptor subunit [Ideonella livida]NDY91501.1 HlyD family type I secretion periplasmic adaptor subunit [Ideonella livida]
MNAPQTPLNATPGPALADPMAPTPPNLDAPHAAGAPAPACSETPLGPAPGTQAPPALAGPAAAPVPLHQVAQAARRRGLWIIGLWTGAFAAWALWAPISGGVVAQGLVKVEANRRVITHRDGGTVARILVHDGQTVSQGQPLLVLEDVRVDASVDLLRGQLAADRLRRARLEAELAGAPRWAPPAALLAEFKGVPALSELAAKERATFTARRQHLETQITGEQRQAQDTRSEVEVRERERQSATEAIALMREELRLNQQLEQAQFVNRARILTLQRSVSDYESRLLNNDAELAQARQRLAGFAAREASLREAYRQNAADELRDVAVRLADTEQRLRSSRDDQQRQTVLAPEAGRLMNLRVNTPGSALGPREPIVDLVPADAALHIEARIPLETGADVRPGTPAEVHIVTAHSRGEKLLAGQVTRVSADAVEDPRSGAAYLLAQVQVSPQELARSGLPLQPGLPAEVYLQVSERTPLGFLLEPVTGYFRRAFRDR